MGTDEGNTRLDRLRDATVRLHGKALAPLSAVAAIGGFVGDVLSPLGDYLWWSLLFSAAIAIVGSILVVSLRWRRLGLVVASMWLWTIASSAFLMLGGIFGQEDRGLVGSVVPGVASLQDRMAGVERRLEEVAGTGRDIRDSTTRIESAIDEIRMGLNGAAVGFVEDPQTPEQWYGNARFHELKGNFGEARACYARALPGMPDKIDAHIAYVSFLRVQEGRLEAQQVYRSLLGDDGGLGCRVATALLQPLDQQRSSLQRIELDGEVPSPVLYLIAERYSSDFVGSRTLEDERQEREWATRFLQAVESERYLGYFVDQRIASEWVAEAERLLASGGGDAGAAGRDPVSINLSIGDQQYWIVFEILEPAIAIEWRSESDDDFAPTPISTNVHPLTGKPTPTPLVRLPIRDGPGSIEVRYLNARSEWMGPYRFEFDWFDRLRQDLRSDIEAKAAFWVRFYVQGTLGLSCSICNVYAGDLLAIKELRYRYSTEDAWGVVEIPQYDSARTGLRELRELKDAFWQGGALSLAPGQNPPFVELQLLYWDGTESAIHRFDNQFAMQQDELSAEIADYERLVRTVADRDAAWLAEWVRPDGSGIKLVGEDEIRDAPASVWFDRDHAVTDVFWDRDGEVRAALRNGSLIVADVGCEVIDPERPANPIRSWKWHGDFGTSGDFFAGASPGSIADRTDLGSRSLRLRLIASVVSAFDGSGRDATEFLDLVHEVPLWEWMESSEPGTPVEIEPHLAEALAEQKDRIVTKGLLWKNTGISIVSSADDVERLRARGWEIAMKRFVDGLANRENELPNRILRTTPPHGWIDVPIMFGLPETPRLAASRNHIVNIVLKIDGEIVTVPGSAWSDWATPPGGRYFHDEVVEYRVEFGDGTRTEFKPLR